MVEWLRKLLRLAVTPSEGTVSAYRRPMGYQQISAATLVSATKLTVPAAQSGLNCGYAIIQCEGTTASVRWRDDGTAPTSSVGMNLSTGGELDYSGDLTQIQFIANAGSPILDISFYA